MDLEERTNIEGIPEVTIEPENLLEEELHGTFVLIQGPNERNHIYISVLGTKHKELYSDFLMTYKLKNQVEHYKPIGGGVINYLAEELFGKNEIEVKDFSESYGRFNPEITRRLLENKFKGFKIVTK